MHRTDGDFTINKGGSKKFFFTGNQIGGIYLR